MRVGADDQIAAGQMPAFGQHLVANAITDVIQRRTVFFGKCAHGDMDIGRFAVRRRRIMIEHQRGTFDMRQ